MKKLFFILLFFYCNICFGQVSLSQFVVDSAETELAKKMRNDGVDTLVCADKIYYTKKRNGLIVFSGEKNNNFIDYYPTIKVVVSIKGQKGPGFDSIDSEVVLDLVKKTYQYQFGTIQTYGSGDPVMKFFNFQTYMKGQGLDPDNPKDFRKIFERYVLRYFLETR